MAFALVHTIGVDDSAFSSGIAKVENRAQGAARSMGSAFKDFSAPIRAVTTGIMSIVGPATLIVGTLAAGGALLQSALTYQERMAQKAREEAVARRQSADALQRQVNDARVRVGLDTGPGANVAAIQQQIRAIGDEYDKLQVKGANLSDAEREHLGDLLSAWGQLSLVILPAAEAMDKVAAAQKKLTEQAQLMAAAYQLQIDLLRDSGNETEALQMAEELRYLQQLEALRKLADGNEELYRKLEEWARAHHEHEMKRIGDEAEAERTKREEENAERARRRDVENDIDGQSLDAEYLRAAGRDEEAKALEEQIRLKRTIEAINRAEGLSEEEKARRIREAQEISRLNTEKIHRDAQAERDKDAAEARRKAAGASAGATIEAGIVRSGLLTRQVFGDPSRSAAIDQQQKQTQKLQGILELMNQWKRDMETRPMLLG